MFLIYYSMKHKREVLRCDIAFSPPCTKILSSYLIALINKHRNSLMRRRVRIIHRFATGRDTISLALRRKRSPIFPGRRFVRSSLFGRERSISESFATSRTRRKQVFTIFARYDIKLYELIILTVSNKILFFSLPKGKEISSERQSDKIAICTLKAVAGKSIDYSKFAIRDFRSRARRTRTSVGDAEREGGGGRGPTEESAESEAKQKWIRDFV